MPRAKLAPNVAAEVNAVNARVAKVHERGFCTWTLSGQIKGPYRLMSKGTVTVKRSDGHVETLRVVNMVKKGALYIGDVHPEDQAARDREQHPWIVQPPEVLPDIPTGRACWSKDDLLELLESLVGTRAMLRFRDSLRMLPRKEKRILLNEEIDRIAGLTPVPRQGVRLAKGERWSDLVEKLGAILGEAGLQAFLRNLQYESDSDQRRAILRAEIDRLTGGSPS